MDKEFRRLFFFLVGVGLAIVTVLSFAETIPATPGASVPPTFHDAATLSGCSVTTSYDVTVTTIRAVADAFVDAFNREGCNAGFGPITRQVDTCPTTISCTIKAFNSTAVGSVTSSTFTRNPTCSQYSFDLASGLCRSAPSCPANQNWTLSADGQTCSRPDCPAGQGRDPSNGQCIACQPDEEVYNGACVKKCIGDQSRGTDGTCKCQIQSKGIFSYTWTGGSDLTGCSNGCQIKLGAVDFCPGGPLVALGVSSSTTCYTYGSSTGSICGSNATSGQNSAINATVTAFAPPPADTTGTKTDNKTPDPKNTKDNAADPMSCGSAGGSYIVFNGVGKCLTPTNDNSMQKVDTTKLTTTNSDNSTTTKNTTSITVNNGGSTTVSSSTTTTNCTAAGACTSSNGSTSATQGTGSGSQNSELCKSDPFNPLCKGDLATETTQKRIAGYVSTDGASLDHITGQTVGRTQADELLETDTSTAIVQMGTVGTSMDKAKPDQDAFNQAMSNWFDVIPRQGCSPISWDVGPLHWTQDICPTAEKISTALGYAMWISFVFYCIWLVTSKAE